MQIWRTKSNIKVSGWNHHDNVRRKQWENIISVTSFLSDIVTLRQWFSQKGPSHYLSTALRCRGKVSRRRKEELSSPNSQETPANTCLWLSVLQVQVSLSSWKDVESYSWNISREPISCHLSCVPAHTCDRPHSHPVHAERKAWRGQTRKSHRTETLMYKDSRDVYF